jgi:ubiquinone/menaquinone biosynthesis C-methylase UbiE
MAESGHNRRVRAQFAPAAEAYVVSAGHATGSDLQRLVEVARPSRQDRALDVATGGGHTALALAPSVASVLATDLVPEMLRAAARLIRGEGGSNVAFAVADAQALPLADASFDLVTCRIAPHHFADAARFAAEVGRVLRPGGRLVLIDSIGDEDPDLDGLLDELERRRDPTHVRSHPLAAWRAMLADAGLAVDHEETFRRTHVWSDWTARSGMPEGDRAALEAFLRGAPERFRERYAVRLLEGGAIESWVDFKCLIRATKDV